MNCPAGLEFSTAAARCEFPANAKCTSSPDAPCDQVVTAAPVDYDLGGGADLEEAEAAEICRPACPPQGGLLANPQDCTKFYQCAHGVAVSMNCPAGLEFSTAAARCEFPSNAKCTSSPDAPCDQVVTAAPVDYDLGGGADSGEVESAEKCLPTCKDTIMPHPQDCHKFFLCSNNVPHEMHCPDGLHYAQGIRRCELPKNARCTASADAQCV